MITIERERGAVRMVLRGVYDLAAVAMLDFERRKAIASLALGPNRHMSLVDVTGCELSTREVVTALQQVIGEPRFRSLRCAMVVGGALARMQARRVVQRADVAMFDSVAAAENWLFGGATSELCAPHAVATFIAKTQRGALASARD